MRVASFATKKGGWGSDVLLTETEDGSLNAKLSNPQFSFTSNATFRHFGTVFSKRSEWFEAIRIGVNHGLKTRKKNFEPRYVSQNKFETSKNDTY